MRCFEHYSKVCNELVSHLEYARRQGRMPHALLVASDDETARNEFALVAAQIAGCPQHRNGVPDIDCEFCRRLENNTNPELHTLSPVGKMYQIKVGDRGNPEPNTVRAFISDFQLTSLRDWRKIGIIYEADRMGGEAQNALLKTLEEPPPDTTIILVTGNPAALLPTTRSRCQLLTLPALGCRYDFAGSKQLFAALRNLIVSADDWTEIERNTSCILSLSAQLEQTAKNAVEAEFAALTEQAERLDDRALLKRIETRRNDAVGGACMRERRKFLSAISCFCFEVYLLSQEVALADLPNPELLPEAEWPRLSAVDGEKVRQEAETLLSVLRYNVNEELALRSFALNLANSCAAGRLERNVEYA